MKSPIIEIIEMEEQLTSMFDSDQRIGLAIVDFIRENKSYWKKLEK